MGAWPAPWGRGRLREAWLFPRGRGRPRRCVVSPVRAWPALCDGTGPVGAWPAPWGRGLPNRSVAGLMGAFPVP